jgi:hypothetical protein
MANKFKESELQNLPVCAAEYIKLVIKKMRYRKKVRLDVQAELAAHFEDELRDCSTDEEKEQKARRLIEDFGDVNLLAVLLRRAKKRCRPLWRTIVARTVQTVGVLILFFAIYTGWFLTGKPTINVDYLALLNQMNRPQVQDEDNAWPNYEKAIALFVEPDPELSKIADAVLEHPSFGGLSDEEQQKIRKWVELNKSAWQEFVTASSKPYCYRQYQYDPNTVEWAKWLFSVILPHLSPLRNLARVGIWQARMQTDSNQPHQAVDNCLVIARVGSHWQGKGFLVEQLVGQAISNMACAEILNIVGAKNLSSADLNRIQQQLVQIYPQGFPLVNMEDERLMFMDAVQHIFTKGGPGGGHLVPRGLQELQALGGIDFGGKGHVMSIYLCTPASMLQAGRDEMTDKGNEIYDCMEKHTRMSPYERHVSNSCDVNAMLSTLPEYRFLLIHVLMPAIDKASDQAYQGKALYHAAVTVLAIKRWRLEEDKYPEKLDELVAAGYLKDLPMDPFSDQPLVYKRTEDNFTLYSVGLNFKDDGGRVYRDEKGQVKKWADESDTVFWPVPK